MVSDQFLGVCVAFTQDSGNVSGVPGPAGLTMTVRYYLNGSVSNEIVYGAGANPFPNNMGPRIFLSHGAGSGYGTKDWEFYVDHLYADSNTVWGPRLNLMNYDGDCLGPDGASSGTLTASNCFGPRDVNPYTPPFYSYSVNGYFNYAINSGRLCRDSAGNCVPGMQDSDGTCLTTPLAGALATIEGPPAIVPTAMLLRSAELYLPDDAATAFVTECAADDDVMGDKIAITRDRWNALAKTWRPRMKRWTSSSTATAVHTALCNGCGSSNTSRASGLEAMRNATPGTPEYEQAMIDYFGA